MNKLFFSKKGGIVFLLLAVANFMLPVATVARQNNGSVAPGRTLRVGVAGSAPFVTDTLAHEGISIEIWQALATNEGWDYKTISFEGIPAALQALEAGDLDLVVGPVSITSERVRTMAFSQPYFQSSLSILSRTDGPSLWGRIRPFFSMKFFIAVLVFLFILSIVGTFLWIAERRHNTEQFPEEPLPGIANGMWCAIVTMSTTGYGDKAPVTFWGRVIASSWMVISIIFATSMVAGIASTLTLTGLSNSVIGTATELHGKKVAVVDGSDAEDFVRQYGSRITATKTLEQSYNLLDERKVDAVVYDRPQLLYLLQQHHNEDMAVSVAQYDQQGYGFALPLGSKMLHEVNIGLLQLEESGQVDHIAASWLGTKK